MVTEVDSSSPRLESSWHPDSETRRSEPPDPPAERQRGNRGEIKGEPPTALLHLATLDGLHLYSQWRFRCHYLVAFGPLRNLLLHLGGRFFRPLHLPLFLALLAHRRAVWGRGTRLISGDQHVKSVPRANPNRLTCQIPDAGTHFRQETGLQRRIQS